MHIDFNSQSVISLFFYILRITGLCYSYDVCCRIRLGVMNFAFVEDSDFVQPTRRTVNY